MTNNIESIYLSTATIGIIGVTGIVGNELIQLFNKHTSNHNIKLCASDKSVGTVLDFDNKKYTLEKLDENFFNDEMKFAFFCANDEVAIKWATYASDKNIICIDNSAAHRMNPFCPLVIPEINFDKICMNDKIIANPNCSTVLLCMVLYPLTKLSDIVSVDVTTYQAVSGAGQAGIDELENQMRQYHHNAMTSNLNCFKKYFETEYPYLHSLYNDQVNIPKSTFKSQILLNCFSHNSSIDMESGYNGEELKIMNETNKILNTTINISATCVRIPVMRAHSESVKIVFENPVSEDEIMDSLKNMNGVKILNDKQNNLFPEPLIASGTYDVYVGRIRMDYNDKSGRVWHLFLCGDQVLKGAALNAFQIYLKYVQCSNPSKI